MRWMATLEWPRFRVVLVPRCCWITLTFCVDGLADVLFLLHPTASRVSQAQRAFLTACYHGDLVGISEALARGARVDIGTEWWKGWFRGKGQMTGLHLAAEKDHREAVLLLISEGAHPLLRTEWGKLPVDYAVSDEVRTMLEAAMEEFEEEKKRGRERMGEDTSGSEADSDDGVPMDELGGSRTRFVIDFADFGTSSDAERAEPGAVLTGLDVAVILASPSDVRAVLDNGGDDDIAAGELLAAVDAGLQGIKPHAYMHLPTGVSVHDGDAFLVYGCARKPVTLAERLRRLEWKERKALADAAAASGTSGRVSPAIVESLQWRARLSIAHQLCDVVGHLHSQHEPPVHAGGIRPANILLEGPLDAPRVRLLPGLGTVLSRQHDTGSPVDDIADVGRVLLALLTGECDAGASSAAEPDDRAGWPEDFSDGLRAAVAQTRNASSSSVEAVHSAILDLLHDERVANE